MRLQCHDHCGMKRHYAGVSDNGQEKHIQVWHRRGALRVFDRCMEGADADIFFHVFFVLPCSFHPRSGKRLLRETESASWASRLELKYLPLHFCDDCSGVLNPLIQY